jgi:hypothetical protein
VILCGFAGVDVEVSFFSLKEIYILKVRLVEGIILFFSRNSCNNIEMLELCLQLFHSEITIHFQNEDIQNQSNIISRFK